MLFPLYAHHPCIYFHINTRIIHRTRISTKELLLFLILIHQFQMMISGKYLGLTGKSRRSENGDISFNVNFLILHFSACLLWHDSVNHGCIWLLTYCLKQIRETPHKRHHKFIEFFDVRAAEAALRSLNRSDIAGKRIKLEPSRPGGARRKYVHEFYHCTLSLSPQ